MRRYVVLLMVGAALLTCCGCNSIYMPELNVSDFDKVAEYAAYALLSDADGYESKLIPEEEVERLEEERALKEQIDKAMEELENQGTTAAGSETKPDVTDKDDDKEAGSDVQQGETVTVSSLFDIEGINIQYAGYELSDIYPNTDEDMFVLRATEGNQFLVLSFVVQNTTEAQAECNIIGRDILYKLSVEGHGVYRSQLTVLENDLSTWNMPVSAGSTNMAVLVFQVPDELTTENVGELELSLRENKVTKSVVLK